jgi:hypothetical protein
VADNLYSVSVAAGPDVTGNGTGSSLADGVGVMTAPLGIAGSCFGNGINSGHRL